MQPPMQITFRNMDASPEGGTGDQARTTVQVGRHHLSPAGRV